MWKRVVVRSTCFLCPKDVHRVKGNIPYRLQTPVLPSPEETSIHRLIGCNTMFSNPTITLIKLYTYSILSNV